MASFSLNDGLNTAAEGCTAVLDVLVQVVPGLDDGSLQLFHAWVGGGPGLAVHDAPDRVIQWIKVWAGGRSQFPWPEDNVLLHPVLHRVGSMAGCRVLLKDVLGVRKLLVDPGLHHSL